MDSETYSPEYIEAWLRNELPEEETAAFREKVQADPALADAVLLQQLAMEAGNHLSEEHLQQKALSWAQQIPLESIPEKGALKSRRFWLFLTGFLFLAVALAYFLYPSIVKEKPPHSAPPEKKINSEPSEEKGSVAETPELLPPPEDAPVNKLPSSQQFTAAARELYDAPDSWLSGSRSGDLRPGERYADSLYRAALAAFLQNRLKKAETLAKAALTSDSSYVEALRLLAHTQFLQNKFQEAAQNFEAMKARYSSRDEEATWNLLLCHYARYREADARKSLHKQLQKILKDPEHAYTKAALRLKKAVESQ